MVSNGKTEERPDNTEKTDIKRENLGEELITQLHQIGSSIATFRDKPLLLIFYSREQFGAIEIEDIHYLEEKLEESLKDNLDKDLDVVIQTTGGDADGSYLLAQLIRDYCSNMEIFVPYYAYSGGTLITLASNLIHLGKTARLSPIDIQLEVEDNEGRSNSFSLLNIEEFIEFINDTCEKFSFKDEENKVEYLIPQVEKLIVEVGAMDLGKLFRMRTLSEYHAGILLKSYMYKNDPDKSRISQKIIQSLTKGSPDHDFEIDFHIAKGIGLKVKEMDENIYKLSRRLMNICSLLKREGKICNYYTETGDKRMPYFQVFLPNKK